MGEERAWQSRQRVYDARVEDADQLLSLSVSATMKAGTRRR